MDERRRRIVMIEINETLIIVASEKRCRREPVDGSLLIPMCKNSKLKATTTTTISNSDNLSLEVSSLAS
jgi:hypothetical protein